MPRRSANPWSYKCVGVLLVVVGAGLIAVSELEDTFATCDRTLTELHSGTWSGSLLVLSGILGLCAGKSSGHTLYSLHLLFALVACLTCIVNIAIAVIRLLAFTEDYSGFVLTGGENTTDAVCTGTYDVPVGTQVLTCPDEPKICCNCTSVLHSEGPQPFTTYTYEFDFVGFAIHHGASAVLILLGLIGVISTAISTTFFCGSTTFCGKPKDQEHQTPLVQTIPAESRREYVAPPQPQNYAAAPSPYPKLPQTYPGVTAQHSPYYGGYGQADLGYEQPIRIPRTHI